MLTFLFNQTPLTFFIKNLSPHEALSYLIAKKNIIQILSFSGNDFTPPLYYLLLHFWVELFGKSEVTIRSLSVIFFVLSIYLAVDFMEEVFHFSLKKSLAYSLIIFFNPFLLKLAFVAEPFSMFLFFIMLSFYSFYTKKPQLYLISTVLGLYTHYFMVFAILIQGVSTVYDNHLHLKKIKWESIKEKNFMNFIPILFFLPWLGYALIQHIIHKWSYLPRVFSLKDIINIPAILYTGNTMSLYKLLLCVSFFSLLLIGLSLLKIYRNKKNHHLFLDLLIWTFVPSLLVITLSLFLPFFSLSSLVTSSIGLMMLLIYCINQLDFKLRVIAIMMIIIFNSIFLKTEISQTQHGNFSLLSKKINATSNNTDTIYTVNVEDFYRASFYINSKQIYLYNKSPKQIPYSIENAIISKDRVVTSLPSYPKRAFIIEGSSYQIQSAF